MKFITRNLNHVSLDAKVPQLLKFNNLSSIDVDFCTSYTF